MIVQMIVKAPVLTPITLSCLVVMLVLGNEDIFEVSSGFIRFAKFSVQRIAAP